MIHSFHIIPIKHWFTKPIDDIKEASEMPVIYLELTIDDYNKIYDAFANADTVELREQNIVIYKDKYGIYFSFVFTFQNTHTNICIILHSYNTEKINEIKKLFINATQWRIIFVLDLKTEEIIDLYAKNPSVIERI